MKDKFIVYDKETELLVNVYDVKVDIKSKMKVVEHRGYLFEDEEKVEIISFLIFNQKKNEWAYKNSSYFEEYIEGKR